MFHCSSHTHCPIGGTQGSKLFWKVKHFSNDWAHWDKPPMTSSRVAAGCANKTPKFSLASGPCRCAERPIFHEITCMVAFWCACTPAGLEITPSKTMNFIRQDVLDRQKFSHSMLILLFVLRYVLPYWPQIHARCLLSAARVSQP